MMANNRSGSDLLYKLIMYNLISSVSLSLSVGLHKWGWFNEYSHKVRNNEDKM